MRVAAVQLEPAIGDVAANLTAPERLAGEAARAGAEWIVFPEFFTDSDACRPPLVQRATLALDAASAQPWLRAYPAHSAQTQGQTGQAYELVEIPVPTKGDVMRVFEKVAKPPGERDD